MSLKQIDQKIRRITTNAQKLNELIHETAVMVAEHAKEHGDCTRALTLVKAMPASMRRTMLVLWFNTYTPIRVVFTNDKVGILKESAKGYTPFDIESGKETPFYELAEQNAETQPLDFDKLIAMLPALAKRIEKKVEEGEVEENAVPIANNIATTLKALKFDRPANDEAEADREAGEAWEEANRDAA